MAQLFFLDKCGYLNSCPYWYNGILTLKSAQPGWYFFTLPLYKLTNDVLISVFISLLIIFILGFLAFYLFGRLNGFSLIKITAFFILFFGNAIAVGNFIRLGRINELYGWLNFIPFAFILLWYKDHKLDKNFFWTVPFLSIILLSHQTTAILSLVLLLGLFLIKNGKEKLKIILSGVISFLLASFWLIPYIISFFNTEAVNIILTRNLFSFDKTYILSNIAVWLVIIFLFFIFYFYWIYNNKSKKELIFFLPTLIIAVLLFFGLTFYIPILKFVYPDSHLYYFIFLLIFMLFKTDLIVFNGIIKKMIFIGLILLPIISVAVNVFYTPYFIAHGDLEKDTLYVLDEVDGRFIILTDESYPTSYTRAYYSYAAIYLSKYTSSGFYQQYISQDYFSKLKDINSYFKNDDPRILETLNILNTTSIISYDNGCNKLEKLNLEKRFKKGRVCLYINE
ncbi:hypothetical protein HYX17_00125 [Candidatus Woesearchaeota archaeon]|nr:hypothetical protein [Candidatus Woesearchaeota archaeon]